MEIGLKSSLDGSDGLAISLASITELFAPVLAAMLVAQNKSKLRRWPGECYIGREKVRK